jgi:hypothetical protein
MPRPNRIYLRLGLGSLCPFLRRKGTTMSETDRTSFELTPAQEEGQRDKLILLVLCEELVPWTVEELGRELADVLEVEDGVGRLVRAGLAHRLGDFVFPTRAGRRAHEIEAGTI